MSMRKDVETYLDQLREAGYTTKWCPGANHWMIKWGGRRVATVGGTPGPHSRSLANLKGYIRRFERQQRQQPAVGEQHGN